MEAMEDLYSRGFISYPRTETTIFHPSINLKEIVKELSKIPDYASFTDRLYSEKLFSGPKNGKLDDKAHPPIHPVKAYRDGDIGGEVKDEWGPVYDLISRSFLATISRDAIG